MFQNSKWPIAENKKKIFFEKVLEQNISFNFLKSKVSDVEVICQKYSSLISKNLKNKGWNFRQPYRFNILYLYDIDALF